MKKQRKWLVRARKTSRWGTVGSAKDKHQAPTNGFKLYVRAIIESEAWPTVVQLFKEKPIAIKFWQVVRF